MSAPIEIKTLVQDYLDGSSTSLPHYDGQLAALLCDGWQILSLIVNTHTATEENGFGVSSQCYYHTRIITLQRGAVVAAALSS